MMGCHEYAQHYWIDGNQVVSMLKAVSWYKRNGPAWNWIQFNIELRWSEEKYRLCFEGAYSLWDHYSQPLIAEVRYSRIPNHT
jgi:hypothetical protein